MRFLNLLFQTVMADSLQSYGEMYNAMGFKLKSFSPQTDGQLERTIQDIGKYVKIMCLRLQRELG